MRRICYQSEGDEQLSTNITSQPREPDRNQNIYRADNILTGSSNGKSEEHQNI